jgi:glyoxylase-like metal-dependent hydrolase (beta-lactamase superfamily II)
MSQPIRIELPFQPEGGSVNVYLFVEPEPILIDAGPNSAAAWDALQEGLATNGLTAANLTRVIITHPHVDHFGLAARIARAGGAEIWMSEVGIDSLRHFPQYQQRRIDYYRAEFLPGLGLTLDASQAMLDWMAGVLATWEPIPAERWRAFSIDAPLMLGGRLWQVLHLPGHEPHLTAFFQPESRQLLSSDALIIPTATPVVDAPPPGQPSDQRAPALPQMMASLRRLAALEVAQVHPGHGSLFAGHQQVIAGQLLRIEERKEECWRALVAGATTVADLFQQIYGARAALVGPAGLWMTVGYLDLLLAEGRVAVQRAAKLWRYRAL